MPTKFENIAGNVNKFKLLIFLILILFLLAAIGSSLIFYKIGKQYQIPILFEGQVIHSDSQIGYSRARNAVGIRRLLRDNSSYHIFTDQYGARVNWQGQVTASPLDFLTVGCSMAEGHRMENQETFTARIGDSLNINVANFSIGSYGGVTDLLTLRRFSNLKPKIVVYAFIEDHFRRNITPCASTFIPVCLRVPYVGMSAENSPRIIPLELGDTNGIDFTFDIVKESNNQTLLHTIISGLKISWYSYAYPIKTNTLTTEQMDLAFSFVAKEMKATADSIGAQIIFLYIPTLDSEIPSFKKQQLLPPGVIFIDSSQAIRAKMHEVGRPALIVAPDDAHPSAITHKILADLLHERLLKEGLLTEHTKVH